MASVEKPYWLQVSCNIPFGASEEVQEILLSLGALSTQIVDVFFAHKLDLETQDLVNLRALFDASFVLEEEVNKKLLLFTDKFKWQKIVEEDWQENFNKSCTTFKVDPDIYIVPSFEIKEFIKKNPQKLFIEIEPQNAFGSGHHQTTKLCLTAIYEYLQHKPLAWLNNANCLDIGTGSAILAILMGKLGAKNILATENDAHALQTAKENLIKNNIASFTMEVGDDYQYKHEAFDLITANILAHVLKNMAINICNALRPDAHLILSGILQDQALDVQNHFKSLGLEFLGKRQLDAWVALEFKKLNF